MQSVYSFKVGEGKILDDEIVFFKDSIAKSYDLYFLMFSLLKSIKQYVDDQLVTYNSHKILKDQKYLKLKRLSDNCFLEFINQHKVLNKYLKNKKFISWDLEFIFTKDLVEEIISNEAFKVYLDNKSPLEKDDLEWLIKSFKNIIASSSYLYNYLEDNNLTWIDDLPVVNTFILKTLKKLKTNNLESLKFPKIDESFDDIEFGIQLLKKSILEEEKLLKELEGKTPNWGAERIAQMDKVILKIAIAEILHFPEIPTKVTINEYLEISKDYSTPNSNNFINGVLDKLVREFVDEKRMIKQGRGLL
jgi:N utilization substance protein B